MNLNKYLNNVAAQGTTSGGGGACCYRVGPTEPLHLRGFFCKYFGEHESYGCQLESPSLPNGVDAVAWRPGQTCGANPCVLQNYNGSCCVDHMSSGYLDLPPGCYDPRVPWPYTKVELGPFGPMHTCEGDGFDGRWTPNSTHKDSPHFYCGRNSCIPTLNKA